MDSTWHEAAYACVQALAEGRDEWAIPWPCVYEFLAIATHPRIYDPPTPLDAALDQVDAWLEAPGLVLLSESGDHWKDLRPLLKSGKVAGGQVHDARIAALCLRYGIRELWSADRDFSRFPELKPRNPLVEAER